MAGDKKITDLDSAGALAGTETLPIVQSASTVKVAIDTIKTYIFTAYSSFTQTLTNKRVTKRAKTNTYNPAPTPQTDDFDVIVQTAMTGGVAVGAPSGTPTSGQDLVFKFKDDGTPRAITWDGAFIDGGGGLPSITTANKVTHVFFMYDLASLKWMCINTVTQP